MIMFSWEVLTTFLFDEVEIYYWDGLMAFQRDVIWCFIWDVTVTLLGHTGRSICNVVTTSSFQMDSIFHVVWIERSLFLTKFFFEFCIFNIWFFWFWIFELGLKWSLLFCLGEIGLANKSKKDTDAFHV